MKLAVPRYRGVTMTYCVTREMRMNWTDHGGVSRVVDSPGIPVGFLKIRSWHHQENVLTR